MTDLERKQADLLDKMVEALEFYTIRKNYKCFDMKKPESDCYDPPVDKARKALAEYNELKGKK